MKLTLAALCLVVLNSAALAHPGDHSHLETGAHAATHLATSAFHVSVLFVFVASVAVLVLRRKSIIQALRSLVN